MKEGDSHVEGLRYPDVYSWFDEVLQSVVEIDPDDEDRRWCRMWHRHPEVVARMTALWRSWEHIVQDPATGLSMWMTDHLDPHMDRITSPTGPLRHCRPATSLSECDHREPKALASQLAVELAEGVQTLVSASNEGEYLRRNPIQISTEDGESLAIETAKVIGRELGMGQVGTYGLVEETISRLQSLAKQCFGEHTRGLWPHLDDLAVQRRAKRAVEVANRTLAEWLVEEHTRDEDQAAEIEELAANAMNDPEEEQN